MFVDLLPNRREQFAKISMWRPDPKVAAAMALSFVHSKTFEEKEEMIHVTLPSQIYPLVIWSYIIMVAPFCYILLLVFNGFLWFTFVEVI